MYIPAQIRAPKPRLLPQRQGRRSRKHSSLRMRTSASTIRTTSTLRPASTFTKIEAAAKSGGYSPQAMNAAVGHYGTFDFQRVRDSAGNTTFYSGYTPVSNF